MSTGKVGRWATLIGLVAMSFGVAQAASVEELARETQKTSSAGGQITMVWWMPAQFWEESMKANPGVPEAARAQVLAALADYTIVTMVRATSGPMGLADAQPKAELLKNARVEYNGKVLEPVPAEQVSAPAQLLLAQLKPAMAAMVGQVGQGMEFIVYPSKVDGKPIDPTQPGSLNVKLYEQSFSIRLPLGALLPARVDARSGEQFPGNYQFNPFTGDKLITR